MKVPRKINAFDVVGDHSSAEVQCLLLHQLYQLDSLDGVVGLAFLFVSFGDHRKIPVAVFVYGRFNKRTYVAKRKPRIVLDFCRKRELPKRDHDVVNGPFVDQRLEIGSSCIDCCRPPCRATSDDDCLFDAIRHGDLLLAQTFIR